MLHLRFDQSFRVAYAEVCDRSLCKTSQKFDGHGVKPGKCGRSRTLSRR